MEIDKLIELIENEEGELAFTIAKGLGLSMELLNTFWDTKRGAGSTRILYIKGLSIEWDPIPGKWYFAKSGDYIYGDWMGRVQTLDEKSEAFKLFINEINKLSE